MKTNSGILDVCILLLINLMEGEGQQYFNPMEVEEQQNINPVEAERQGYGAGEVTGRYAVF